MKLKFYFKRSCIQYCNKFKKTMKTIRYEVCVCAVDVNSLSASWSHVPNRPPPLFTTSTEGEYRQLDQICRAVNTSSLKRTSNSFIKLTTLAAMSATVEAKNSSIISRATLRLLAILDYTASRHQVFCTPLRSH